MIHIKHSRKTGPQAKFWTSPCKFRLFVGGVGSGKTRAGCVEILRQPSGSTGMVLAPTYPMLRDATLRTFLDLAQRGGILESFNKAEMAASIIGDRTVLFRSADAPDRLRGPNLGWFYLDEAAMMKPEVWLIMIGRLREDPAKAWVTTTPRGKNWLYQEFVKTDGEHEIIRASSKTNPFLPVDFVRVLEETYDDRFAAQEIGGEFLDESFGGLLAEYWVDRMSSVSAEADKQRLAYRLPNPSYMGVDLGEGTGRDRTVAVIVDRFGIIHLSQSNQVGIPEAANWIADLSNQWGVRQEHVTYDAGGRGKDLPRYLEHYGITDAVPYHGSGKGGLRAKNKRAACAWRLRQRLDPERPEQRRTPERNPDHKPSPFDTPLESPPRIVQPPFGLPSECPWWPSMAEELKALRYDMDGVKVRLETKEDMAKRLGRSPDLVDAILMAFSLMFDS